MTETASRRDPDPRAVRILARVLLRSEMRDNPGDADLTAAINAAWDERRADLTRQARFMLALLARQGHMLALAPRGADGADSPAMAEEA